MYNEALEKWISSDDPDKCPRCGKKYSIPGLDANKCPDHGWVRTRKEQVRQYCLFEHEEKGKKKVLNPNDLSESEALAVSTKLRKGVEA